MGDPADFGRGQRDGGHGAHRTGRVVELSPPDWDWSLEVDGALALDPDALWVDFAPNAGATVLKGDSASVSVPRMPRSRAESASARQRRADRAAARRARRITALVGVAVVALVTLLLTAFGSDRSARPAAAGPAPATRLLPAGPPSPQAVALAGTLRIQLPIAQTRVTVIGYHATSDGALALQPLGRQANEGALTRLARRLFGGGHGGLRYYELGGGDGPATAALDIGAAAGTDVYSPVDGTIVGLIPYVVNGRAYGSQIDLQPSGAPSLVVSLTHLRPDASLAVGSSVSAGTSKLGRIVDFSGVERQALARYTQDGGNHVELQVREAAATVP